MKISCCRSDDPKWRCISMHDDAERRGIWFHSVEHRDSGDSRTTSFLEICAGREGDDGYARLEEGQVIDRKLLSEIENCLMNGEWMFNNNFRSRFHLEKLKPFAQLFMVPVPWLDEFIQNESDINSLKFNLENWREETVQDIRSQYQNHKSSFSEEFATGW